MQCRKCPNSENGSKVPFGNTAKVLGVAALVGILGSGIAMAKGWGNDDDRGPGHHGKGKMMMYHVLDDLDLTDAQEEKIEAIQKEMRKDMMSNRGKKQNNPLLSAIKDGKFDKTAFLSAQAEIHNEMATKRADNFEKVYNVLTDTQKKKFVEEMQENQNCRKGRF